MVGGLSHTAVGLTDTVFISRLGDAALGGVGNGVLLHLLFVLVGLGLSTGMQIIMARRNGEGNHEEITTTFRNGLMVLAVMSAFFVAFIQFFLPLLTPLFVHSKNVENILTDYVQLRSWTLPIIFANGAFTAYFVSIAHTRIIGIATPLAALLNVVLDYLLIFGFGIIPAMGPTGAAWASNASDLFMLLVFLLFVIKSPAHLKILNLNHLVVRFAEVRLLLKVSLPLMMQNFMSFMAWFAFFSFVELLGETELAVSHMIRAVYMLLIIPVFGLGDATNSLVSNLLGRGHPEKVYLVLKRVITMCLVMALFVQPLYWLGYRQIFGLFNASELQIEMGRIPMLIIFTALFLFSTVMMGFRAIAGTGKTTVCLIMEGISVVIYLLSAWWLTTMFSATLSTVWLAEYIYFGIFGILVFTYLKYGKWQTNKF